jgi:hypothetical protein
LFVKAGELQGDQISLRQSFTKGAHDKNAINESIGLLALA